MMKKNRLNKSRFFTITVNHSTRGLVNFHKFFVHLNVSASILGRNYFAYPLTDLPTIISTTPLDSPALEPCFRFWHPLETNILPPSCNIFCVCIKLKKKKPTPKDVHFYDFYAVRKIVIGHPSHPLKYGTGYMWHNTIN